jgi:hypothetical protein
MDIGTRGIKVQASEYKGKWFVNIRQWYEQDGVMKPGAKGISLSKEEWDEFVDNFPSIINEIDTTIQG